MVKLNHSLASVSNALNHQIGSLHVIKDGIIQLDKIMGTTRIFRSDRISSVYIVSKWVVGFWLVTLFQNVILEECKIERV